MEQTEPTLVGKPLLRREDRRFLTGKGTYLTNHSFPGALSAVYVRSTMAHARIVDVDTNLAKSEPGVRHVLTSADLSLDPIMPDQVGLGVNPMMTRPWLAGDVVRYVGEPVAVVIAETQAQAVDAAELVDVDYDPLPVVTDVRDALRDEVLLFPDAGTNVAYELGEAASGGFFDDCEVVVSTALYNQRLAASPMEVRSVAASWDDDRLTFWCGTQTPHAVQDQICFLFGLEPRDVRVRVPDVGGGFGAKIGVGADELLLVELARLAGVTVTWTETRNESMTAMVHGRAQRQVVEIGGSREGRIEAYRIEVLGDSGAYPRVGAILPTLTGLMAPGPYAIAKVEAIPVSVVTNTTPVGAYRGAGRPEATAAIERAVDMFAAEIGLDPVEVRRRNLIPADAFPFDTATDATYDSGDYEGALNKLLEHIDYPALRAEQERRRIAKDSVALGIGVSVYVEVTAPLIDAETASIDVGPQGRATIAIGTMCHGQGHETAYATLAAERLGMAPADIDVVYGDTARVVSGEGTAGSRSIQIGGSAVIRASDELVTLARELAAERLEAPVGDVVLDRGRGHFHVVGTPAVSLSWVDLGSGAGGARLGVEAAFDPVGSTFPFGAHAAIVDVDTETGNVNLVRMVAVDDAGRIVNPVLAEGQIHGGLAQGIAQAIYEEFVYDKDGNPLSPSLMNYLLPAASEMPSFETSMTETPSPLNELGAKGIGESGTIGSTPAVHNAVLDALRPLGVDHIDMPLSPQRIWRAIEAS